MNLEQFLASDESAAPHLMLLGNPVAHSLSPLMHNTAAEHFELDLRYYAIRIEEQELGLLASHLNAPELKGANVTIPYKERLVEYVDQLDATARTIGALNTIVKNDHRLTGYNTDIFGFREPLNPYRERIHNRRAVIFGTGGATKAIVYALDRMGASEIILISRNPGTGSPDRFSAEVRIVGYEAWTAYSEDAVLIVNATPLGMKPHSEESPVRPSEKEFLAGKICYDIVYNPVKTRFLSMAEEVNAELIHGLDMLIHQAGRSFELWTGKEFPVQKVKEVVYEHL